MLEIDGASNRGIDEIRQLRSNVNVRPSRARYKVYIIDEVHMLTREAFNGLLKTLEEPPEHVKFIFCTTEPNKIPITVLSRCQRFDFAGIDAGSIVDRLAKIVTAEGMSADREALLLLARRAAGSMRDSQSLLEQLFASAPEHISVADVHAMLGTADNAQLVALARSVAENNPSAALAQFDRALSEGVDVGQLLEQLLGIYRDGMVALAGCDDEALLHAVSPEECESVRGIAELLGLETTLAVMQVLQKALADLRHTTHRRTVAEVALIRISKLDGLDALADLVASLNAQEASSASMPLSRRSRSAQKKSNVTATVSGRPDAASASGRPRGSGRRNESAAVASPSNRSVESRGGQDVASQESNTLRPSQDTVSSQAPVDVLEPQRPARPLTEENAKQVWEEALAILPETMAARAGECEGIAVPEPNRLVVTFDEAYHVCKASLERSDQVAQIEAVLEKVTGGHVHVVFALSECSDEAKPESRPVSRQQRLTAANRNALVRRASDLFGARPVDVGPR